MRLSSRKENLMIKLDVLNDIGSDIEILIVDSKALKKTPKALINTCNLQNFCAKHGEVIFIQDSKKLLVGIDNFSVDCIREIGAIIVKNIKKMNIISAKIKGFSDRDKNYALMLGILLGDYSFSTYKTSESKTSLRNIYILDDSKFKSELELANTIAISTNLAREIVNTPPEDCVPLDLANIALNLAKEHSIKCKIGDIKFLKKEKMNAFLAVSKASINEPRLIHLSYIPKTSNKRIVLVGKGLTYDTGGLSLKPSDYMTTMKADKSGGCAVLGIMKAISMLKPNFEVHGIVGASENMIGGNAYKPDDILYTREGVSVEVKNTDAEGRLVLADCLSYAQDLKPDYIIDLATLTGACVVALGEYTSGIMGYNEELKNKFEIAASISGELMAKLPFNKHLEKLLESKNADVSNISSSRYGGAITAGLFLGKFIRDEYKDKWLHIDIAGPAFVEKEWDVNPYGASGAGVRSVVNFILSLEG